MSDSLEIHDVSQDARRLLAARAAAAGQSLNDHLLAIIEREVARPTTAEVFERATRHAERVGETIVDIIHAERTAREEELMRRLGL